MRHALVMVLVAGVWFITPGQNVADSIVYDKGIEWQVFSADGPVQSFCVHNNIIWMSTPTHVAMLDIRSGKLANFMRLGSAPAENVPSIVRDNDGTIWFATTEGVAARRGESFTNYTTDHGLGDNQINKLLVARDGSIWAATGNGASVFSGGTWKTHGVDAGLAAPAVTSITQDQRGALWFGTARGISVFHEGKWQTHSMKTGLSWNSVKALAADHRKGEIWAAVGEKDINRFNGTEWQQYMDIQEGIVSIMADTQSRIWFGSPTGLIRFNGMEWITDAKTIGVPAAMVTDMYRDGAGNLWFASENGVVFLTNPYPF